MKEVNKIKERKYYFLQKIPSWLLSIPPFLSPNGDDPAQVCPMEVETLTFLSITSQKIWINRPMS